MCFHWYIIPVSVAATTQQTAMSHLSSRLFITKLSVAPAEVYGCQLLGFLQKTWGSAVGGRAFVECSMRRFYLIFLLICALGGCALHEVYERPGLTGQDARQDWAACEEAARIATGIPVAGAGDASIKGDQLYGRVRDPESDGSGMYSPAAYLAIKRRQQIRQDCMKGKGYIFLGVPAVEML